MDAKVCFERFATTTVIRVFNFIRTSAFLVERLFWIAILIGFSFATIWNVVETVKTFLSEPTASRVTLVSSAIKSNGMTFPGAMICLEMRPDLLLKRYEGQTEKVVAAITSMNSGPLLEKITQKLDAVHHVEERRAATTLNSSLASFTNATTVQLESVPLGVYHANIDDAVEARIFTEEDVALVGLTTVMFTRLVDAEMNQPPAYKEWQSAAVERVYDAYMKTATNFSELFRLTAKAVCVLHQLKLVTTKTNLKTARRTHTSCIICTDGASVSFFGMSYTNTEMICYRVHDPSVLAFRSVFDYVTLTAQPQAFYGELAAQLDKLILVDLSGAFALEEQQPIQSMFNEKKMIEFTLETVSHLADLRRRPCSPSDGRKGTHSACALWCRAESVMLGCECASLMREFLPEFASLPPGTFESCAKQQLWSSDKGAMCSKALAQAYVISNSKGFKAINCSQQCYPNCETYVFASVGSVGDPVLDYLMNVTTAMRLVSTKFFYEEIIEYVAMDGKAFISALGGNLSLFLGASFLALIHIVVFVVRLPFERAFRSGATAVVMTASENVDQKQPNSWDENASGFRKEIEIMKKRISSLEITDLERLPRGLARRRSTMYNSTSIT